MGGHDAPIVAYQRNETSGSQNFMHTFMADTTLMDPLTSAAHTPASMGQLMDAVAVYDNAEYAIGYSVYAYAADMYGNGNENKFIHVDGVEPTKATMADDSYPLLSCNYAVYDAATPADSSLRKPVDRLTTDEGQRAVQAAGEWSRMTFVEGGRSGPIDTLDLTGTRLMQMVRTNAGWKLEFRYADSMDNGVSITIPDEYIQWDK